MQGESALEDNHFHVLNARHDVAEMREQVFFYYGPDRDQHHIFDVLVTLKNGTRLACTVKPAAKTTRRLKHQIPGEDFLSHMQMVAGWVEKLGFADETRLLTDEDLDPVELHNARIVAAFRDQDADPGAEFIATSVIAAMQGGVTLRDLTIQIDLQERGYHALLRLVRLGELLPANGMKITPQTILYRKGTYQ
jgi:hypothetical protein